MRRTCYYLLANWLEEINHAQKDNPSFLIRAEKWNNKNLSCGHCSLNAFLDYLNSKRLERRNVEFWQELRKKVFIRDSFTCSYCGKIGGILECDHIIPFSKGGSNELENLTTACRKCNRQKKDKLVEEFLNWKNLKL